MQGTPTMPRSQHLREDPIAINPATCCPSPHHVLPAGICLFRALLHWPIAEALPYACLWLNSVPHDMDNLHALCLLMAT